MAVRKEVRRMGTTIRIKDKLKKKVSDIVIQNTGNKNNYSQNRNQNQEWYKNEKRERDTTTVVMSQENIVGEKREKQAVETVPVGQPVAGRGEATKQQVDTPRWNNNKNISILMYNGKKY